MTAFAAKTCQQQVMGSVEACFDACQMQPSASIACAVIV